MWEMLIFLVISAAENSNKFPKKPGFEREKKFTTLFTKKNLEGK
jgi:hypothetical protein